MPTPTSTDLRIRLGFSEANRPAAAALYDEAFGAKFAAAIPLVAQRQAVILASLRPGYAFTAFLNGELVGLAGVHSGSGSLTSGLNVAGLFRLLGGPGGLRAVAVLSLLSRSPQPGELLMDGIAVRSECRGLGIGGLLLDAVTDHAASTGLRAVRLSVVDGNAGARRLYERKGFVAVSHDTFALLGGLLGFSGATRMTLNLPGAR